MSVWTRLHRLVNRVASALCRHPEGTICEHNAYDYDLGHRAYVDGMASGTRHAETEQRGLPPYDDHPCLRCGRLDCNDINAIVTLLHASSDTGTPTDG